MEDVSTWDTRFRDSTQYWVQFVFVPVIVIIGVLGNSVTICILTRKQMQLSSKVYLTALTLSDLLYLLFSFSLSWKHYECVKSVKLYWNYIPFGLWITDASSSTSAWLTVIFTMERYIAIFQPPFAKDHSPRTMHQAAEICTAVYFLCFLFTSTTSFEWIAVASYSVQNTGSNDTTYALENTNLGKNAWYRLIYRTFSAVVFVLIPLLVLVIGNIFLIFAVQSSNKIQRGLVSCYVHGRQAQKMRQKGRVAVNLIVIILVFLICQLPTAVILVYTSMHTPQKGSVEENVLLGLGNLFNLLITINAECNFVLYTGIGNKNGRSFLHGLCSQSVMKNWFGKKIQMTPPKIRRALEDKTGVTLQSDENMIVVRSKSDGTVNTAILDKKKHVGTLRKCTTCEEIEKSGHSLTLGGKFDPKTS